jgi:hypothetical protein
MGTKVRLIVLAAGMIGMLGFGATTAKSDFVFA